MNPLIKQLRTRRQKSNKQTPTRGTTPHVNLTNNPTLWTGWRIFLGTALVVFIAATITFMLAKKASLFGAADQALGYGIVVGLIMALLYYLLPILQVLSFMVCHQQRPPRRSLSHFSGGQKFVSLMLMALGLFYLFNHVYPSIATVLRADRLPDHWFNHRAVITVWWHSALMVLGITVSLAILVPWFFPKELKPRQKRFKGAQSDDSGASASYPFGLWLGRSTGRLARLWHRSGLAPHHEIVLSTNDAAQNVLVLGGIGAGKTTCLMQPLLAQLLDQECGGLLFDVKGDVKKTVIQLSEMANRQIIVIGPNHNQMNLLAGLTPEVAASFLKSAFLLSGGVRIDGFWVNMATELCHNNTPGCFPSLARALHVTSAVWLPV